MAIINLPVPTNSSTPLWEVNKHNHLSSCLPSGRATFTTFRAAAMRNATMAAANVREQSGQKQQLINRRSGNYEAPLWEFDYIQSLKNEYAGDIYVSRANELKEQVKMMLDEGDMKLLDCMELVDGLERLGLAYHFEGRINRLLSSAYKAIHEGNHKRNKEDLYAAALEFRIFRQNGFNVPQDIFNDFITEDGEFDESLSEDTMGLLSLYEASFLSLEGEATLDLAREFTTKHLNNYLGKENTDQNLRILVYHALELPLRWRAPRIEARWYIDAYERSPNVNPTLLELAKIDFNIVQAIHQQDLKHVSWWWKNIRIAEKLTFIRDRIVENFFWAIGAVFEPQYGSCRRMLTKVFALITMIDDIYDVYGTLEELELFTDAVDRWDVKAIDQLPDYMRVGYLGFFNSINEMAYDALKEQGVHIVEYLRKVWADLCKAYLQEAKWYYAGYTPTVEEYLENAWVSMSVPVMLMHAYAGVTNPMNKEAMDVLDTHDIVRCSSYIQRFANDLGTSPGEMKRGDVPKLVQCYMKEAGCSEEESREHVWFLLRETWKKMNKDSEWAESPFSKTFVTAAKNFGRVALVMYQYGDGHGLHSNPEAKDRILASLFSPVPPA
ncbi:terpene synthase 10-like [Coffea eugenioides]|uniref:terpene synthase 10-like n=1 Tax=Coffea eugenioides TaxID=49369 RepID=UPI000F6055BE|nr:terpene synthase 10-like [Coffea eugenioides]XP_027163136.1 terpene synthase 10-like [Coffea eugenioides]